MLNFHSITINDYKWATRIMREEIRYGCEYTFANNYLRRNMNQVEISSDFNCVTLRYKKSFGCGPWVYSYPIGNGDKKAVITELLKDDSSLVLSPLLSENKTELEKWFPGRFLFRSNRNQADYIYSREKLAFLAGRKFSKKRNHIARFTDSSDWHYEEFNHSHIIPCLELAAKWQSSKAEKWNKSMDEEYSVMEEALHNYESLGLVGGVLYKGSDIVAFCMGEPINSEIFDIHFEKADTDIQGSYAMINRQFARNALSSYKYVNREEDTGDEGLRKAKLSYYPDIILTKYSASVSDVVFADPVKDKDSIINIWSECFGDSEDYIDFYLNNRASSENMLVIKDHGQIVSMASFLDASCELTDHSLSDKAQPAARPVKYVYAVATLSEYRNKGNIRKIFDCAKKIFNEPLILQPSSDNLFDYYKKLGFKDAFEKKSLEFICSTLVPVNENAAAFEFENISADDYKEIRDEKLGRPGYIIWDEAAIEYAIKNNSLFDGRTLLAANKVTGSKDIIMYSCDDIMMNITETTLSDIDMENIACLLVDKKRRISSIRVRCTLGGGMILDPDNSLSFDNGYLNLTLG